MPPYFLAIQTQRWHRLCVLCHEPVYCYAHHASQERGVKIDGLKLLKPGTNASLLCETCHHLMTWRLPPIRLKVPKDATDGPLCFHLYFATYYQYPINQALNKFKDHENLSALMVLFHALRQLPKPVGCHAGNTVIMPIPTTNKRLAKRGFYPVMVLARYLAYHWHLPIWQGLIRIADNKHQRGLDRETRLDNIQDVFLLNNEPPVRQLILFDDVVTTGATMQAAVGAVMQHSPTTRIIALCVAHGTAEASLIKVGG